MKRKEKENSNEKSPNKRQKKNQRPGDEASSSSTISSNTATGNTSSSDHFQQQIDAKIKEFLDNQSSKSNYDTSQLRLASCLE